MAATETSTRAAAALDDLYRHHVGEVYRYTYAVLGNHADAEDVTQTTFVNALRALERGEEPRNGSAWLIAIAQNVVRQRWRHASSRPTEVELVNDVPETPPDDDIELDELVRALQRIPPAQREALVLRELEGRPYSEIAELLGLTTSALETLLFRARRSLAEELEALVTCQTAELAISKQLDGRLGRKERRRLDEHLADCPDCARLAATQQRRRRAFKGLALLPLPIGLALFKGAPSAAAATSLPTIGLGTAGAGTSGTGAAGAAGAGATATTTSGGAAVGGSFAAGLVVKVAAVVVTATVAAGVGYKGVQAVRQTPAKTPPASVKKTADKAGTPSGAVTPRVTHAADVKKAAVEAKGHGKPVSSPGRAKHGAPPQPGLATSQAAKEPGNNAGHASSGVGTGAKPHPAGGAGPKHTDSPAKPKTPASGNDAAKPNGGKGPQAGGAQGHAQDIDAPEAPKTPKTPKAPASGGGSSGPAAPGQGGDTTSPTAAGSAPTGDAPATNGATTGSTSPTEQPPASTPPASTPSTPPTTTTPPPTEQTPPSGSTETPPDPSDAHSNNGWDDGKKLGHYKENQDGKHLVTP